MLTNKYWVIAKWIMYFGAITVISIIVGMMIDSNNWKEKGIEENGTYVMHVPMITALSSWWFISFTTIGATALIVDIVLMIKAKNKKYEAAGITKEDIKQYRKDFTKD